MRSAAQPSCQVWPSRPRTSCVWPQDPPTDRRAQALAPECRGTCSNARTRADSIQRLVRENQFARTPGHRCLGLSLPCGEATGPAFPMAPEDLPPRVGLELYPLAVLAL